MLNFKKCVLKPNIKAENLVEKFLLTKILLHFGIARKQAPGN